MAHHPKPRTVKKYAPKVRRYFKLKGEVYELYEKIDKLEGELLEVLRVGDRVPLKPLEDGTPQFARFQDNYIDKKTGERKNKAWRSHGISQFELVVSES